MPPPPPSDAARPSDIARTCENGKRKFSHSTTAQRQCLLEWLELPGNFELLITHISATLSGFSTSTLPLPKRVKKMDGFRVLAQHMNKVVHTSWSKKTARSRFESFMATYRKAKRQSPENLPPFYQPVDALSKNVEKRARSESLVVVPSTPLSPLPAFAATTNDQGLKFASLELAVKQQELELKQLELRAQQVENSQKLPAEVLIKLVQAGKSPAEVREYLAIMDPVDKAT
ncbi:hypothetical protein PsorP6_007053 [Peronosclerospora sorghi]|uniref:Uncharacterized protein n=1 Tax=Peronosclerospora sorghi TaxID=230839 RepID=A0ACC0WAJ6_9STRA|nr:hypothetical protein PsorP6_007053 [Peronosclerospora sorghi]